MKPGIRTCRISFPNLQDASPTLAKSPYLAVCGPLHHRDSRAHLHAFATGFATLSPDTRPDPVAYNIDEPDVPVRAGNRAGATPDAEPPRYNITHIAKHHLSDSAFFIQHLTPDT